MTLGQALSEARSFLQSSGIEEAALEAEVMVMQSTGLSRARLYASLTDPAPTPDIELLLPSMLARRAAREPLAYIVGFREFFGLEFEVNKSTLIPRQETEALVETSILLSNDHFSGVAAIVDIGTGSGAIAISLAVLLSKATVIATDISGEALRTAAANANRHGVAGRISFRQGDLLRPIHEPVDIVVANLPYVTKTEMEALAPEIKLHEPSTALEGGVDGLDLVRRLLEQVALLPSRPRFVALELGEAQITPTIALAENTFGPRVAQPYKDISGAERGILIELTSKPNLIGLQT